MSSNSPQSCTQPLEAQQKPRRELFQSHSPGDLHLLFGFGGVTLDRLSGHQAPQHVLDGAYLVGLDVQLQVEERLPGGRLFWTLLVNYRPDVSTKNASDGGLNKGCLVSDWGLVSGAHLLPRILTSFSWFFLLLFIHRVAFGTTGNRKVFIIWWEQFRSAFPPGVCLEWSLSTPQHLLAHPFQTGSTWSSSGVYKYMWVQRQLWGGYPSRFYLQELVWVLEVLAY